MPGGGAAMVSLGTGLLFCWVLLGAFGGSVFFQSFLKVERGLVEKRNLEICNVFLSCSEAGTLSLLKAISQKYF